MISKTNEQALESAIEKHLTGTCLEEKNRIEEEVPFTRNHGYKLGFAAAQSDIC